MLRSFVQQVALVAFGLLTALALLEVGFRIAGWAVAGDPARLVVPEDDRLVILSVGDSHTWGLGRGYPAALAERLAKQSPRYRVLNLGVPASNTALWRAWLPGYLDRFRPRIVVFWAGINNFWNRRGTEVWQGSGLQPLTLLGTILEHSRVWRFLRVWRHHADLSRLLADGQPLVAPPFHNEPGDDPWQTLRRHLLDDEEVHFGVRGDDLDSETLERVTERDVLWLAERCRDRGIPFVVITYPIEAGPFLAVNAGLEAAAHQVDAPIVRGAEARRRVEARFPDRAAMPATFDESAHPTQVLYDEIGALVYETLQQRGLLPE